MNAVNPNCIIFVQFPVSISQQKNNAHTVVPRQPLNNTFTNLPRNLFSYVCQRRQKIRTFRVSRASPTKKISTTQHSSSTPCLMTGAASGNAKRRERRGGKRRGTFIDTLCRRFLFRSSSRWEEKSGQSILRLTQSQLCVVARLLNEKTPEEKEKERQNETVGLFIERLHLRRLHFAILKGVVDFEGQAFIGSRRVVSRRRRWRREASTPRGYTSRKTDIQTQRNSEPLSQQLINILIRKFPS